MANINALELAELVFNYPGIESSYMAHGAIILPGMIDAALLETGETPRSYLMDATAVRTEAARLLVEMLDEAVEYIERTSNHRDFMSWAAE